MANGNPYQGRAWKDPRQSAQESASTLSSYFQDQEAKQPKTVSPYSAPAEPANGAAPSGGGRATPSASSAPKSAAGGGTGFVSFGQYFGANAPAVQAQAQQAVAKARSAPKAAVNAPVGTSGLGTMRPTPFGPMPTAQTLTQRQKDPFAAQMAEAQRQSQALQPLANYGDMGKDVSAFDQLLGGGLVQREAKQEQQRLGSLRGYLEAEQAQRSAEQARRAQEEAARREEQRRQEEADWYARQEEERKYYEQLRAQEEYAMDQEMAGQDAYLDQLPDEY